MQLADLFASLPIWVVLLGTLLPAVASVEAGHRWGRHKHEQALAGGGRENEAPAGAMVGAMLGLLAFLLAFTFGMAADGFHERKVVLLHEANAIRATHLRAALIVEPERSEDDPRDHSGQQERQEAGDEPGAPSVVRAG